MSSRSLRMTPCFLYQVFCIRFGNFERYACAVVATVAAMNSRAMLVIAAGVRDWMAIPMRAAGDKAVEDSVGAIVDAEAMKLLVLRTGFAYSATTMVVGAINGQIRMRSQ